MKIVEWTRKEIIEYTKEERPCIYRMSIETSLELIDEIAEFLCKDNTLYIDNCKITLNDRETYIYFLEQTNDGKILFYEECNSTKEGIKCCIKRLVEYVYKNNLRTIEKIKNKNLFLQEKLKTL